VRFDPDRRINLGHPHDRFDGQLISGSWRLLREPCGQLQADARGRLVVPPGIRAVCRFDRELIISSRGDTIVVHAAELLNEPAAAVTR
jgi:hypothetical protein